MLTIYGIIAAIHFPIVSYLTRKAFYYKRFDFTDLEFWDFSVIKPAILSLLWPVIYSLVIYWLTSGFKILAKEI